MKAIQTYWNVAYQFYAEHPFLSGVIVCAGSLLLLYLIICIALLFRAKRLKELTFNTPHGQVAIRSSAIAAFVRSQENKFPEIKIDYIKLLRKHGQVVIFMTGVFTHGFRTLPEVAAAWEECILAEIKKSFGIDAIKKVEVHLIDAVSKSAE